MSDEETKPEGETTAATEGAETEAQSQATEAQSVATTVPSEAGDAQTQETDIQTQNEGQSEMQSEVQSEAPTESKETKPEEDKKEEAEEPEEPSTTSTEDEEEEFSPLGPVVSSLMGDSDEEEEEDDFLARSLVAETKLLREPIDREAYLEEYKNVLLEQAGIQRKNSFLAYKLSMYFKRKKMDDTFVEGDNMDDIQLKYEKKLDELYFLKEKGARDQFLELEDIKYMQESLAEQTKEREDDFRLMQKRERDIGKGLIDTRTGKAVSDKQIERLIRRQYIKSDEISDVRLKYIKKKDTVRNLENQLKTLETIDGKLHLIEYEQLRMENHNLSDKIEERDEELRKLRIRYNAAVQTLAHMREKSHNATVQIEDLGSECSSIEDELSTVREFVNSLKVQRDINRAETMRLKNESGLLTCTNLLIDMERRWDELDKTRDELTSMKATNKTRRKKLDAIRKNIEHNTERGLISVKPVKTLRKSYSGVYRGRPSLIEPKFNDDIKFNIDLDEEFD